MVLGELLQRLQIGQARTELLVDQILADVDPLLDDRAGGFELLDRGGGGVALGLFLRLLAVERRDLGAMLLDLLGEISLLHLHLGRAGPGRRIKFRLRIVGIAQAGPQPGNVEAGGHEVVLDVLFLGRAHRRVELDEDIAGLDALPIADLDGAYDAGLEWLDQLDAAVGHDLAGRRGDDVDVPETGPDQAQAEHGDERCAHSAADRRRRRLHDFQRRRQEGDLVALPARGRLGKGDDVLRSGSFLADFMDPTLQSVERRVASARPEQLVVGPVFDHTAMIDGDDPVGHAHRR